jgi:hypothetical protein
MANRRSLPLCWATVVPVVAYPLGGKWMSIFSILAMGEIAGRAERAWNLPMSMVFNGLLSRADLPPLLNDFG